MGVMDLVYPEISKPCHPVGGMSLYTPHLCSYEVVEKQKMRSFVVTFFYWRRSRHNSGVHTCVDVIKHVIVFKLSLAHDASSLAVKSSKEEKKVLLTP